MVDASDEPNHNADPDRVPGSVTVATRRQLLRSGMSIALSICVGGWITSCSLDDTPTLRVGANIWPGYEPLYLAHSLGYYDPTRVKLIDFPSAVEVIRAYRNGVIDVAALTGDEALRVAATEPDRHRIILVADYSNGADVILARPEFHSMQDLRGHTIGVERNALGVLILSRALDLAGMTLNDVHAVHVPLGEHETALTSGQVDAIVTFEPRRTRLLAKGAHEVFSSARIPGEVIDVLIARESLFKTEPKALVELVRGWFKAITYQERAPADAAARIAAHEGVTREEYLRMAGGLHLATLAENRRLLMHGELREPLARVARLLVSHRLLSATPNTTTLLDGRWINEASQ